MDRTLEVADKTQNVRDRVVLIIKEMDRTLKMVDKTQNVKDRAISGTDRHTKVRERPSTNRQS